MSAILQKGVAPPNCSWGVCNPVNFTILNFTDPRWNWEKGHMIGILTDGLWNDPRAKLIFKRVVISCKNTSYQVFHSFYEMEKVTPLTSPITRNMFLTLAEMIAQSPVSSCYVCGEANIGDQGP
jgi:hypothetical protein